MKSLPSERSRWVIRFLTTLGGIGLLLCLTVIVAVWAAEAWLQGARLKCFTVAENTLQRVEERLRLVQQHVEQARDSAKEMRDAQKRSALDVSAATAAHRAEVAAKLDLTIDALQQADHRLESTQRLFHQIQQGTQFLSSLGVHLDTDRLSRVVEGMEAASLRIGSTSAALDDLVRQVQQLPEHDPDETVWDAVRNTATRQAAVLVHVDQRLETTLDHIGALRSKFTHLAVKSQRTIRGAAWLGTLLLTWMAAGQASLCYRSGMI